jgi:energy-coupling factor transport system ATP-binding protein
MTQVRLNINDLSVRYIGRREPAIDGVSLAVADGSVVGLTGATGAGKSTLALAAAGFIPRVVRAKVGGSVRIGELEATQVSLAQLAGQVGIVFSEPALQLSASKATVREELAFGLENLAVRRAEMDPRIDDVLRRLGIAALAERQPLALSGGEQQRVAIASIVVLGTRLLVLDEPAAQLDPGGTIDLAQLLTELAADGRAVLVAEHSTDILAVAEECLVLESGQIAVRSAPATALATQLDPPTIVRLAEAAGIGAEIAFDETAVAEGLAKLAPSGTHRVARSQPVVELPSLEQVAAPSISIRGLVHRYPGGVEAVRGVDLAIEPGETVAIVGQNGSGKTTLAKHLNGLLRPDAGSIQLGGSDLAGRQVFEIARQVGFVFQNPDDQLFKGRVEAEVGFGPSMLKLPAAEVAARVELALELVGLSEERATNPYDLGLSLRKLVALASVLAMRPQAIVLDEPTTGQDRPGVARIGAIIDALAAAGHTVIAITHDMEFAARHFARVVVLRQGQVVLDRPPEIAFAPENAGLLASTGLRPPPAARIAALLGLDTVPADADALLALLARR